MQKPENDCLTRFCQVEIEPSSSTIRMQNSLCPVKINPARYLTQTLKRFFSSSVFTSLLMKIRRGIAVMMYK